MDVRIQAIHFDAGERLVAFINKKAERLARHNSAITTVDVKLTVVKPETAMNKEAVVKVTLPQGETVAAKTADSFEEAVDLCLEAIEKQLEKRKEMAEAVHKQMIERNFSACRGCHDLSRMHNAKKPFIAKMHQNLDKDPKKPADCLACHPKAGHDYAAADAEMAKAQETAAK